MHRRDGKFTESRSGHASLRCAECAGGGSRDVPEQVIARYHAAIEKEARPSKRDDLRRDLFRASICPACNGVGEIRTESGVQLTICDDCDGAGCETCFRRGCVSLGPIDDWFTSTACPRCHGTAEVRNEDLQDVCPLCHGRSWVIACTVKARGSNPEGGSTLAADDVAVESAAGKALRVEDAGEAPRREDLIQRVRARDPELGGALADIFGPDGDRWAPHQWGRAFVLWTRVSSGRRLIERSAVVGRPIDVLASARNACEVAGRRGDPLDRILVEDASQRARVLYERAMRALHAEEAAA